MYALHIVFQGFLKMYILWIPMVIMFIYCAYSESIERRENAKKNHIVHNKSLAHRRNDRNRKTA